MSLSNSAAIWASAVALAALSASLASAHSVSDAYLTLESAPAASGQTIIKGQWEIALRDLDFVLTLDDNGDGNITWGELRRHQSEIARYAYAKLQAGVDDKACALKPTSQQISQHADGAYAALSFEIACSGATRKVALDYRLFFEIDPSHRCILVMRDGAATSTALLSPARSRVELK